MRSYDNPNDAWFGWYVSPYTSPSWAKVLAVVRVIHLNVKIRDLVHSFLGALKTVAGGTKIIWHPAWHSRYQINPLITCQVPNQPADDLSFMTGKTIFFLTNKALGGMFGWGNQLPCFSLNAQPSELVFFVLFPVEGNYFCQGPENRAKKQFPCFTVRIPSVPNLKVAW